MGSKLNFCEIMMEKLSVEMGVKVVTQKQKKQEWQAQVLMRMFEYDEVGDTNEHWLETKKITK